MVIKIILLIWLLFGVSDYLLLKWYFVKKKDWGWNWLDVALAGLASLLGPISIYPILMAMRDTWEEE